jgi:hypothetical protein
MKVKKEESLVSLGTLHQGLIAKAKSLKRNEALLPSIKAKLDKCLSVACLKLTDKTLLEELRNTFPHNGILCSDDFSRIFSPYVTNEAINHYSALERELEVVEVSSKREMEEFANGVMQYFTGKIKSSCFYYRITDEYEILVPKDSFAKTTDVLH